MAISTDAAAAELGNTAVRSSSGGWKSARLIICKQMQSSSSLIALKLWLTRFCCCCWALCSCGNGRAFCLFRGIVKPDNVLDRTIGSANSCSCSECERLDWHNGVSSTSLGVCSWRVSWSFPYYHHIVFSLHLGM